jgi:hypothetical protein
VLRHGAQVVNTLSVRDANLEPVASRLHAEALLGGVELRPPGLAPAAILCVRRLVEAWPGGIHVGQPSIQQREAFRRAVSQRLERAARSAARPAHEAVPVGAEAVLFADRAELLHALARDLLRQCVAERWWWASLLPHGLDDGAVLASFRAAPAYVPAAFAMLVQTRELAPFVLRWPASELASLARAVAEVHALHWLPAVLDEVLAAAQRSNAPSSARLHPPWVDFAAESEQRQLSPAAQLVCGVAITLADAPARARSRAFRADVAGWASDLGAVVAAEPSSLHREAAAQRESRDPSAPRSAPASGHAQASPVEAPELPPPAPATSPMPSDETVITAPSVRAADGAASPSGLPSAAVATPSDAMAAPLLPSEPEVDRCALLSALEPPAESALVPAPAAATVPREEPPPRALGRAVSSELGGLFFLVNLGLYLELYGDFSTPLTPGIALSIWDFVAIVGASLLAADGLPDDPVWALLARLADRAPGTAPGHDFDAPDELRMPAAWLRPFAGETPATFTLAGDRLRIVHPRGFALVDVPAEPDLHAQAQREAAAYAVKLAPGTRTAAQPESALSRWCGWLTSYARLRLARALARSPDELGRTLCRLPARIHVSATHVDIVMALADLPLEVRLAGLDRDPGWLPGAGRTLAFHFA